MTQTGQLEQQPERILIVDDDSDLCDLLKRYLSENGYDVSSVGSGPEMDQYLRKQSPELIILDIMLPGEDGLSIARRLKAAFQIPVIILSARGDEVDRILGLEMGADDYLPKPFSSRELLARIRARLRSAPAAPEARVTVYQFANFTLDLIKQQLRTESAILPITTSEFLLLKLFLENADKGMTRDQIVQKLKGMERGPFDRSIDIQVTRLRKKIEPDPSIPIYIRTVWGKGYLFTPSGNEP
jgi:DNA-binding response OmpR family regulator